MVSIVICVLVFTNTLAALGALYLWERGDDLTDSLRNLRRERQDHYEALQDSFFKACREAWDQAQARERAEDRLERAMVIREDLEEALSLANDGLEVAYEALADTESDVQRLLEVIEEAAPKAAKKPAKKTGKKRAA